MKKAFSLIELLISLIIVSLITTALMPILTKRIKNQQIAASQGINVHCEKIDPECRLCMGKKCILCDKTCTANQFEEVENCACINCKTQYKEGCQTCDYNKCLSCQKGYGYSFGACQKCADNYYSDGLSECKLCSNGYVSDDKSSCIPCITNCKICSKSGCSACKEGYKLKNSKCYKIPSSQSDCNRFGAFYFTGLCITRRNAGDSGGPGLNSPRTTIETRNADDRNWCTIGHCCWNGATAVSNCSPTGSGSFDYASCHRTVCNYYAAGEICYSYAPSGTSLGDWRLPTAQETTIWAQNSQTIKIGLQLCDHQTGYGVLACFSKSNACLSGSSTYCAPYGFWIEGVKSMNLNRGGLNGPYATPAGVPASVRCVLDAFLE